MKKGIVAIIVIALVALAGTAMGADTATVDITATVLGTCEFSSVGTNIGFGTLPFDASGVASGDSAVGSIDFRCTNGAVFTITDDDGLHESGGTHRLESDTVAPLEYIPYTLAYVPTALTGQGWGTWITLNMTADIAAGAYTNNSPDTYSDTVTLTITP